MFERIIVTLIGTLALAACLAIMAVAFMFGASTYVLPRLLRSIWTKLVWTLRITGSLAIVLSIPTTILMRILSYRPDWVTYWELALLTIGTLVLMGSILHFTSRKTQNEQSHN